MKLYLGADHRGFQTKERIKGLLTTEGIEFIDLGAGEIIEGDDYIDYAQAVAEKVVADTDARGIVICGSGVGVDMVANKVRGVRSGLGIAHDQVMASRKDDDINVLALAADYTLPDEIDKMVKAFLTTPFSREPRYQQRLDKVKVLEGNE